MAEVTNAAAQLGELAAQTRVASRRKAAARRLAEAGCTPHEIMSITGHTTLKEVTRYTDAVNRERLARSGMARLKEAR